MLASCTLTDLDGFSSGGPAAPDAGEAAAPVDTVTPLEGGPADSGAAAEAGPSACAGTAGPTMVRVGTYCIDATEVTAAQYAVFVAAGVRIDAQPPECAFNTSYAPRTEIAPDNLPVRFVDWCDARAYCAWAGKRLCGAIGGGPSLYANPDLPHEEWFMACSANNTRAYPYGPTYVADACNAALGGGDAPVFVGSKTSCEGGVPGIFDMSGNVREWTNSCSSEVDGGREECIARGGASDDGADVLACGNRQTDPRSYTSVHLGFRCCSDAM
jgi:formylglycine-generating enzyme required for sulfatase activity